MMFVARRRVKEIPTGSVLRRTIEKATCDVFVNALTKVATDGSLFEQTAYAHVSQLLDENKAFENVYTAFRSYRDEQLTQVPLFGCPERRDLAALFVSPRASFPGERAFPASISRDSQCPLPSGVRVIRRSSHA
jgi:hypothetical protein